MYFFGDGDCYASGYFRKLTECLKQALYEIRCETDDAKMIIYRHEGFEQWTIIGHVTDKLFKATDSSKGEAYVFKVMQTKLNEGNLP